MSTEKEIGVDLSVFGFDVEEEVVRATNALRVLCTTSEVGSRDTIPFLGMDLPVVHAPETTAKGRVSLTYREYFVNIAQVYGQASGVGMRYVLDSDALSQTIEALQGAEETINRLACAAMAHLGNPPEIERVSQLIDALYARK